MAGEKQKAEETQNWQACIILACSVKNSNIHCVKHQHSLTLAGRPACETWI